MARQTYLDTLSNKIYESTKRIKGDMEPGKVSDLKSIKELIEPILNLIAEAKEKKKYIYIQPLSKWISPNDFEKELEYGYYVYHISSLELRNPIERLEELEKEILNKRKELTEILKEMSSYTGISERELELQSVKNIIVKEKAVEPQTKE